MDNRDYFGLEVEGKPHAVSVASSVCRFPAAAQTQIAPNENDRRTANPNRNRLSVNLRADQLRAAVGWILTIVTTAMPAGEWNLAKDGGAKNRGYYWQNSVFVSNLQRTSVFAFIINRD